MMLNARGCSSYWSISRKLPPQHGRFYADLPRAQLRNHGPQDADISIPQALHSASSHSHGQACRKPPNQHHGHCIDQAQQNHGLAPKTIRGRTPGDAREALADAENGRRETGPPGDVVYRHAKGLDHLGQVRVHGCEGDGLSEAAYCYRTGLAGRAWTVGMGVPFGLTYRG